MSFDSENTTSTVGTDSASKQGGIPLRESEPLSHTPFVHVTLDTVERPKQVEQTPARPLGQPMPIWAQQRIFGHTPDKNARVARTFPQQGDAAGASGPSGSQAFPSGAAPDPHRASVPGGRTSMPLGNSRAASSSRTASGSAASDAAKSPSDPALRVVLEQKEPEAPSQVVDGVEGKVEIGNDHISVPADIYAQDELNDLAANMPLIPRNLIFGKDAPAAAQGSMGGQPFNRMPDPNRSQFQSRPMDTGRLGSAWPSDQARSNTNSFMQGNPRNAMNSRSGFGGSAVMGGAAAAGVAGHMSGMDPALASAGNSAASMLSMSQITPSVAAVPSTTDYRPYALDPNGAAYNPLRPHSPAMFDPASEQMSAWRSPSDVAGSLGSAPPPYGGPALATGMAASSSAMSQPLASARAADPYGSQPIDRMRAANTADSQALSGFPSVGGNRAEQTLPSGMPASLGQPSSASMGRPEPYGTFNGSSQVRSTPSLGDPRYNRMNDLPSPRSTPASAFPSNGDRGIPLDAGTPIPRDSFPKTSGAGMSKNPDLENESLFDQPPVPITEGMKSADTSHKKLRRVIMIVLIAIVLALGGIVGYLVYSGTVNPDQLVPHITIETTSDGSSSDGNGSQDNAGSSSSSASSSSSTDEAGSVVYQYTALTSDGTAYTVEETATFSDDGYCEFTTMKMKFPDADKAKSFTDNLARDYGTMYTLDSLDGANATVTIDNTSLRLDREKYEESLRYSVEDLVILKK